MNLIYKITNKINGKVYIGLTTQGLARRWSEHKSRFNLGERDHKLYLAIRKYGIENFEISVIKKVDNPDELANLEIKYIKENDSFNNGYNMTCGGDVVSNETREKLRKIFTGRKITWYDKILESRRKNKNLKDPREYVPKGIKNPNSKSYMVETPKGGAVIFRGLRQFCKEEGLSHNLLLATLNGAQNHHKGYVLKARFNDYHDSEYSQVAGKGAHPIARIG